MADETKDCSLRVGMAVIYVDPVGRQHNALITACWGKLEDAPCINLLYVSGDESKQDSYGRQIERHSSCSHKTRNPAHGNYWMLNGDVPNPVIPLTAR